MSNLTGVAMSDAAGRLGQLRQRVVSRLGGFRQQFIGRFGIRATHAIEDGATFGLLLGVIPTFPLAAMVIAVALGVDSMRPMKLLKLVDELGREKHIRAQPVYFVVTFLVCTLLGAEFGTVASALIPWNLSTAVLAALG
jgi:hypothetical protein